MSFYFERCGGFLQVQLPRKSGLSILDLSNQVIRHQSETDRSDIRNLPGLSHQPEAIADLADEYFRLLEGGKMSALGQLVEINQLGESLFGPSLRGAEYFLRENRAADRNRHRIGQRAAKAFPVKARRRRRVGRQPVQHHIVEQFVARQHTLRMAAAVGPRPEFFQYPGELT